MIPKSFAMLDYNLFRAINTFANTSVPGLFVFFGVYLPWIFGALVVLPLWTDVNKQLVVKSLIVSVAALIFARVVMVTVIRILWQRDRPFITYDAFQLITKSIEPSFPSGHASAMFAIASATLVFNQKLGIALLIMAGLTAFSRVAIGVHYPSDIIFGAFIGILSGYAAAVFIGNQFDPEILQISEKVREILPFTKR